VTVDAQPASRIPARLSSGAKRNLSVKKVGSARIRLIAYFRAILWNRVPENPLLPGDINFSGTLTAVQTKVLDLPHGATLGAREIDGESGAGNSA